MKTAVIGLGNIGRQVSSNLIAGGENIIVADHTGAKAEAFARESGVRAKASTVPAAIEEADVIVFAVYFDAIKQLVAEHGGKLVGKILVDPSNPIAPDGKGGFKKIIPENQSSGQILAGLIPAGARLVKAFGTLAAASLGSGANRKPERAVLFYATDDKEAGLAVAKLIEKSGFTPVSVGGIDKSIRIEVFGDLHELGKLGRLVSAKEAASVV